MHSRSICLAGAVHVEASLASISRPFPRLTPLSRQVALQHPSIPVSASAVTFHALPPYSTRPLRTTPFLAPDTLLSQIRAPAHSRDAAEGDGCEPAVLEGVACAVEVLSGLSKETNRFRRLRGTFFGSQLLAKKPQALAKYLVVVSATDILSSTTPPVDEEIATVCFNMDESLDGFGWDAIAGEIVRVRVVNFGIMLVARDSYPTQL
jgi:hypothetical protein